MINGLKTVLSHHPAQIHWIEDAGMTHWYEPWTLYWTGFLSGYTARWGSAGTELAGDQVEINFL
jgi:hypothetical protein